MCHFTRNSSLAASAKEHESLITGSKVLLCVFGKPSTN